MRATFESVTHKYVTLKYATLKYATLKSVTRKYATRKECDTIGKSQKFPERAMVAKQILS